MIEMERQHKKVENQCSKKYETTVEAILHKPQIENTTIVEGEMAKT